MTEKCRVTKTLIEK
uniref:Uncharacterized protein n=1 Tax=Anguilla anguilla TaxID=7936 RepID=A0A0E9QJN3_ANGAN